MNDQEYKALFITRLKELKNTLVNVQSLMGWVYYYEKPVATVSVWFDQLGNEKIDKRLAYLSLLNDIVQKEQKDPAAISAKSFPFTTQFSKVLLDAMPLFLHPKNIKSLNHFVEVWRERNVFTDELLTAIEEKLGIHSLQKIHPLCSSIADFEKDTTLSVTSSINSFIELKQAFEEGRSMTKESVSSVIVQIDSRVTKLNSFKTKLNNLIRLAQNYTEGLNRQDKTVDSELSTCEAQKFFLKGLIEKIEEEPPTKIAKIDNVCETPPLEAIAGATTPPSDTQLPPPMNSETVQLLQSLAQVFPNL